MWFKSEVMNKKGHDKEFFTCQVYVFKILQKVKRAVALNLLVHLNETQKEIHRSHAR